MNETAKEFEFRDETIWVWDSGRTHVIFKRHIISVTLGADGTVFLATLEGDGGFSFKFQKPQDFIDKLP